MESDSLAPEAAPEAAHDDHHQHPSRCCTTEDPQAVLDRLMKSPPTRSGYQTPNGWSGESIEAFRARNDAWLQAVAREEAALKQSGG